MEFARAVYSRASIADVNLTFWQPQRACTEKSQSSNLVSVQTLATLKSQLVQYERILSKHFEFLQKLHFPLSLTRETYLSDIGPKIGAICFKWRKTAHVPISHYSALVARRAGQKLREVEVRGKRARNSLSASYQPAYRSSDSFGFTRRNSFTRRDLRRGAPPHVPRGQLNGLGCSTSAHLSAAS